MQALLWPIVTWIFRELVIKFLILTSVIAVVAFLVPYAVRYLAGFIGVGNLTAAFASLSPGIWFFLDYCQAGLGVPLLISAFVARFLIRRLPVIG
ncbi:DUF2523 family protein [Propionivibrio soli]|uniref:DUF2523 family protein n=1 Tax=Propionivibrio soli TaxID=2976531 RepID=UPI0021E90FCC|nr:DUF2523 family protein [Propionivibrio soli]